MAEIRGKLFVLQMDAVELASQREMSFEISDEMIDTTTKGDAAKSRVPLGEYDVSISIGGLYDTEATAGGGVDTLISNLTGSVKATLLVTTSQTGGHTYEIEGYVSNISEEMNQSDVVTYSADFSSTGELTTGSVL